MTDYKKVVEDTIRIINEDLMECEWRKETEEDVKNDPDLQQYLDGRIDANKEALQMINFFIKENSK